MTGIFLQLSRVLPSEYPLTDDVSHYLSNELGFGRLLDYGVIVPRLQQLFEWSAHELSAPGLLDCTRDGAMTYAWPFEERGRLATAQVARPPDGSPRAPAGTPGPGTNGYRGSGLRTRGGGCWACCSGVNRKPPAWTS